MKQPLPNAALLHEHVAALARIDDAVARASARAGAALACRRGCAGCCVDGLSVLPVEAALIEAALGDGRPREPAASGRCAFLEQDGACSIYEARPVLCRTHGLALRSAAAEKQEVRGLEIFLGDVASCELNYVDRAPAAAEILDATALMMLLVTVDRRFRARAGIADDARRVSLRALSERADALVTSAGRT